MLKIVPSTGEVTTIGKGCVPEGKNKWYGGLLGRNGAICECPTLIMREVLTGAAAWLGGNPCQAGRHVLSLGPPRCAQTASPTTRSE